MTPAAPASAEPMKKVRVMTLSTLMPISRQALGSCEMARIARPDRVRRTAWSRPIMSAIAMSIIASCA